MDLGVPNFQTNVAIENGPVESSWIYLAIKCLIFPYGYVNVYQAGNHFARSYNADGYFVGGSEFFTHTQDTKPI